MDILLSYLLLGIWVDLTKMLKLLILNIEKTQNQLKIGS